jgi:adenylate kinase
VIVFGIPGVGKTTACEGFVSRHPEFLYYPASALLSAARGKSAAALRTSDAYEIESNQKLLGQELEALRLEHPERPLLIDGHAVIDNDHQLVRVPIDAVASMRPTGLGLLEATPETVLARRRLARRDHPQRTVGAIAQEIVAERDTVLSYAEKLDLPLEIRLVSDGFLLDEMIAVLRQKRRARMG